MKNVAKNLLASISFLTYLDKQISKNFVKVWVFIYHQIILFYLFQNSIHFGWNAMKLFLNLFFFDFHLDYDPLYFLYSILNKNFQK